MQNSLNRNYLLEKPLLHIGSFSLFFHKQPSYSCECHQRTKISLKILVTCETPEVTNKMGKDNKKEGNEEKLETKFEIVNSAQASAILFITCSPHRIDATYHWKNHHY